MVQEHGDGEGESVVLEHGKGVGEGIDVDISLYSL